MHGSSALDQLPLEVLLALQEAAADPSPTGQRRAALRAADAGFHVDCLSSPSLRALPMEPAPDGVEALHLRFDTGGTTP